MSFSDCFSEFVSNHKHFFSIALANIICFRFFAFQMKVIDEVGPDDDDDEKKKKEEETKKKKKRRVMRNWPRLDELLLEKRLVLKQRTLVIGPIDIADLDNEIIKQITNEAESFQYRTSKTKDNQNRG